MLFTSSASFILGATSGIGAGVSAIAGLIYFFRIRHLKPDELLEKKKSMENKLVDLLKKNNFSVEDYKTGELYEILFQYFEDFINYRDISYELMELKKKISNSSSLSEKEKKLRQLKDEIDDIDSFISTRFATMDKSIHPVPSQDNIEKTLFEIDDLLKENNTEIENKKTLIEKFEVEIDEYDKIENSSLSAGIKLEEILARIDKCREEKEHIKFLNRIFDEAAETWCTEKLEALSKTALEKFRAITGGTFAAEDAAEAIKSIILHPGRIKNEHRAIKKYISFSIKAALSETLFKCGLPPVFLINPFNEENEFSENMKKLLPELFSERQVVVLIPGDAPDIKGNLITL
jgi:hypothetical protein